MNDFKFKCSRCDKPRASKTDRYCKDCRNAYSREWIRKKPKNELQIKKANCRSYAWEYLSRGKISKFDCEICHSKDVQMHHRDLSKPLKVTWLCKECFKSSSTIHGFEKHGDARN